MAKPIALVFGAGPNVGIQTVRTFLAHGFRVVQTSRSASAETEPANDHLTLQCDVGVPSSITKVFKTVREKWGEPNVVIYNAYGHAQNSDRSDPISNITTEDLISSLNINVVGVFEAAKEAVAGFKKLPDTVHKSFIFTGNVLNEQRPLPGFTALGIGKSASAYLMADADVTYQAKGYRFYYVDERNLDGQPVYNDIDGQAHADFFLSLANRSADAPWRATFVKGSGYTRFPVDN